MAYGLKYWNEFASEDNQSYRLEILGDAYTGLTNKIDLDANPVVIRRGSQNQNKYAAILGSSLTFNIIGESPLQWIEFFTSNDKAYRVDLYKNGSIYWTGYVQTDIYTEPYRKGRYVVQVTANDGFANLKDVVYDASLMTTVNGGYNITIDEWLRKNLEDMEIFNFKDPDFYFYEAVDLELDNATVNTSPLTYLHIGYNAKDGEKVYDILNGIIDSFACRIFQKDAAILILPIDSIYAESITYRYRVDDAGGLDPVYTEVTIDNLKRVGRELTWVNDDQVIEIVPAFNEVAITNKGDLLPIFDLEDLTGFTDSRRAGYGLTSVYQLEFEYFLEVDPTFDYDPTSDQWSIVLRLFHDSLNNPIASELGAYEDAEDSIIGALPFFNTWMFDSAFLVVNKFCLVDVGSKKDLNRWVKATYEFPTLDNDFTTGGTYYERTYADVYFFNDPDFVAVANGSELISESYRNLKLTLTNKGDLPIESYTETVSIANGVVNKFAKTIMFDSRQAEVSGFASPATDQVFAMQFYNAANTLAFKNDDGDFIDAGKFYFFSGYNVYLSGLVANRIALNYTSPSIKINGSIRGDLHLDSVVRDLNFPTKKFMVNFIEENLKSGVKQVEIIEISEPL